MILRLQKRNVPWLVGIGIMLGLALLPGTAGAGLVAALLGCGVLALASSVSLKSGALDAGALVQRLSPAPRARPASAISAAAREAGERARRHGGSGQVPALTLLDIGLIAARHGPDGLTMRKGRRFSGDDDALRPWVSLQVPEHAAERSARLRFEISDHRGVTCFEHEQDVWLRDGARDVLSENQLPLAGNAELSRSGGEWELRVSIDALPLGMLTFEMTPSLRRRAAELAQRQAAAQGRAGSAAADPPGLEELMRDPRRRE